MKPSPQDLKKIWDWTQNDIENLFKGFYVEREPGMYGRGPSSGFTIFLVCLMDIWGSLMNDKFGDEKNEKANIGKILGMLRKQKPDLYQYEGEKQDELVIILRHNLVHNYGLKHLANNDLRFWLNIDVNSVGPIINQEAEGRWHIDCMRLKNDLLHIFEEWLRTNNYI